MKSHHLKFGLLTVGLLIVGAVLIYYANARSWISEGMTNEKPMAGGPAAAAAVKGAKGSNGGDLNPGDLLPATGLGAAWSKTNPVGLGDLSGQNFLSATQQMGINTINGTKRNATHDLRSEPPNPKIAVSPWNNSTIEPDLMRKGLGDVGQAPS